MQNNEKAQSKTEALSVLKKSMYRQALLALFLIVLTVVLLFAVTTAWYSNVARTSELMFQVATWGFNGQIWVDESAIVAGPGDDGGVYLTLENESDSGVDASVYVDKSNLVEEMQKRLFFYVDTSDVVNGETVDKIYLGSTDGYDYSVMGKGNLTLTPTYHNDAQIKWEWVYDMLGYYVYGTLQTTETYTTLEDNASPINNGTTVTVQEYLRPIEYDYDEATTKFSDPDSNGVRFVESIGGVSVTTFLSKLTAKDGYDGTVNANTAHTPDGYYPVSIDAATGEGVWLYLCNYSEIEAGIAFDTNQGTLAAAGNGASMKVTLNITAEKSNQEATQVSSEAQLIQALTKTSDAAVKLTQDMALSDSIVIPKGKDAMLDLNGKTLSFSGTGTIIKAEEGSSVVVTNGTVVGSENVGFAASGAELVLNDVEASQLTYLVAVMDDEADGADSKVRIVDCTASVSDCGVYVLGNGDQSGNFTQVVVEHSTIKAGYAGILSNGTEDYYGTDITVIDSKITGTYTAIYHPQRDSALTVLRSELTGMTGIAVKGGFVTLSNSTISGTGTAQTPDDTLEASGWTDTGDGIYVCGSYDYLIDVQINDCVVQSANAYAIRAYDTDGSYVYVTAHSGTFSSDVSDFVPSTSSQVMNSDIKYVVTVNGQTSGDTDQTGE